MEHRHHALFAALSLAVLVVANVARAQVPTHELSGRFTRHALVVPCDPGLHVVAVPPPAAPESGDDRRAPRVFAELGAEVLTLALAGGAGFGLGAEASANCRGWFCGLGVAVGGVLGIGVGTLLMPLLVDAAAGAVGGRGNVGAAYLGLLVGAAAGAGVVALAAESNDGGGIAAGVLVASALLLAGPIVGYELADGGARTALARSPTGVSMMPTVGATATSVTVGVAGTL